MKQNPDDRRDNVDRIQRNIDMTVDNIRRANDVIVETSDKRLKQSLTNKNERREHALEGMRREIKDEAKAAINEYKS